MNMQSTKTINKATIPLHPAETIISTLEVTPKILGETTHPVLDKTKSTKATKSSRKVEWISTKDMKLEGRTLDWLRAY